jgi:hypothetical protein
MKLKFSGQIFEKYLKSNITKIRPVGDKLFHGDGQTDMTKLVITFRIFVNAPNITTELRLPGKRKT